MATYELTIHYPPFRMVRRYDAVSSASAMLAHRAWEAEQRFSRTGRVVRVEYIPS